MKPLVFRLAALTVGAALSASVTTLGAAAHPGPWYWSYAKVMREIGGARVTVGGHRFRVDSLTTLCSGEGRPVVRARIRLWKHFTCTQTTFDATGGVDRDITFRVHVLGLTRFLITDPRFGPE